MTMMTTASGLINDLNAYTALDAGAWRVALYTNNFTPTVLMTGADVNDATYDGYAAQPTGGWSSAYLNASQQAQADAPSPLVFQPTGMGGLPQTIYGWYLDNGSGTIIAAELLASPVTFSSPSDSLTLFPSLKVGMLA